MDSSLTLPLATADTATVLTDLFLVLLAAKLGDEVFKRIGQPAIVGEILGGLVSITIRIEARGTVSKKAIGCGSRTDLACQVTFGLDISIFLVINISFETSWSEQRQIA